MDQLQEALEQITTLTSELNRSTEIAEDTDRRNTALSDELSRANTINETLSHQMEQLSQEMSEEREKSVGILEEELQRQHNLQSFLEKSQQDLHDRETKATALSEDLQCEQQLNAELQAKVQELEQSLHDKQAVGMENQLLQATMNEKERSIESLEEDLEALKSTNQSAAGKNAALEAEIKEHVASAEELNHKLLEAVRGSQETERAKIQLQEKLTSQHTGSASLQQTLEETRASLDREKIETKSLKKQVSIAA